MTRLVLGRNQSRLFQVLYGSIADQATRYTPFHKDLERGAILINVDPQKFVFINRVYEVGLSQVSTGPRAIWQHCSGLISKEVTKIFHLWKYAFQKKQRNPGTNWL